MEEILENLKEKEFKREIKRLKNELRNTGEEPKKKRIKLIDICDKLYRERQKEDRMEEEKRELEEAKDREREAEKEREIEKARHRKNVLLEDLLKLDTDKGL